MMNKIYSIALAILIASPILHATQSAQQVDKVDLHLFWDKAMYLYVQIFQNSIVHHDSFSIEVPLNKSKYKTVKDLKKYLLKAINLNQVGTPYLDSIDIFYLISLTKNAQLTDDIYLNNYQGESLSLIIPMPITWQGERKLESIRVVSNKLPDPQWGIDNTMTAPKYKSTKLFPDGDRPSQPQQLYNLLKNNRSYVVGALALCGIIGFAIYTANNKSKKAKSHPSLKKNKP